MTCPYCESENWSRDGFHMAEEWVSDNYVRHYIQCVCGNCDRHFFERVEYTLKSTSTLSVDQFEARYEDGLKNEVSVWTYNGKKEVE